MRSALVHIPAWTCDVLSEARVENHSVRIATSLEGEHFATVNRVMLALGARWDSKTELFVFPRTADVERTLRDALRRASVQPPAPPDNPPNRRSPPPELVQEMLQMAAQRVRDQDWQEVRRFYGLSLLDVYAGMGHLSANAIALGCKTYAIEPDDGCVNYLAERLPGLRQLWHMEIAEWVKQMKPYAEEGVDEQGVPLQKLGFQAIVAHPPTQDLQDIVITRCIWRFVKPGGRLVTIISGVSWNGTSIRSQNFRAWCDEISADVIEVGPVLLADYGELNDALMFVGVKPALAEVIPDA